MDVRRMVKDMFVTDAIARGVPDPDMEANKLLSDLNTSSIARDIMARHPETSKDAAFAEARRQKLDAATPPPALWSFKECVLEALVRLNVNAGVGMNILEDALKSMDRPSTPDHLTGALWSLQKAQLVAFKETKSAHGSQLHRIRITQNGREKIKLMRDGVSPTSTEGKLPTAKRRGARSEHAIGVDYTEVRNQGIVTRGSEVEVVRPDGTTETRHPVKSLPRRLISDPLPQNMKTPLTDETSEVQTEAKAHVSLAEADGKRMEAQGNVMDIDLREYPLLLSLVEHRAEKAAARERAAKMVEAASSISDIDPEAAENLMTRAAEMEGPSWTPLEKEVLKLLEALGK